MKTDWHRYNLKRRVAQLPPISMDIFAEKFALAQNVDKEEDEYGFKVYARNKNSDKPLTKKLLKKQQRELMRGRNNLVIGIKDGVDINRDLSPVSVTASEFSNFSLADSLAASHTETDYETNSEGYALTSDDEFLESQGNTEFDTDSDDGAETADEEDIIPITTCFYCGKDNVDIETNTDHMFKNHGLYIPDKEFLSDLPGLLEFLSGIIAIGHECLLCGFFGKNLESVRQHMTAKGHCTLPYDTKDDRDLFARFYDFGSEDSSDDSSDAEEAEIDETGTELVLPNGARLGHRSMSRYYRQNVSLDLVPQDGQQTLKAVDRRFLSGLSVREVVKMEKQIQQEQKKAKNSYEKKSGRRVNFQKHFRDELLQ